MELKVRKLDDDDFTGLKSAWSELLCDSKADALFMSWAWLYSWWEVWSEVYRLELQLLSVEDEQGRLVGLAPLYLKNFERLAGLGINRLHFIGNAWRLGPSVRTEYVGLIARETYEKAVADSVARYFSAVVWDELVIADSEHPSAGHFGEALARHQGALGVVRSEARGVRLDVGGEGFSDWVARLGANTRLKALNRRSVFEDDLGGYCRDYPAGTNYQAFFDNLNYFHTRRWGKPCFDDLAVSFHIKVLERLDENQKPRLSELVVDGNVVSALYDIEAGDCIYNLQAGFEEELHKKISLGTLHLGYSIERAFNDVSVTGYDLLAGYGKNTFYKAKFMGYEVAFTTLEFVRSPLLKLLYRCQTCLPQGVKSRINRVLKL